MNYQDIQSQEKYAAHLGQSHVGAIRGAGYGADAMVEQKRQGGVQRELQYMEKNIYALVSSVDVLYNTLSMVHIPAPETAGNRATDGGAGSAMAHQLAAFNSILTDQLRRLEALNQGIDL